MSVSESTDVEGLLDELKGWSTSDRLRLARRILETLEAGTSVTTPRPRALSDIVGLLKTVNPPPTDEECQALLEEELIKKHAR